MPVIVVGADTEVGHAVLAALAGRDGEVRAFVSDPAQAEALRRQRVKVAVGDVSDGSHVGGAALGAFCAVLLEAAAADERERSFAATPDAVIAAWADGLSDARVHRVIWVGSRPVPEALRAAAAEVAGVPSAGRTSDAIATDVARLDEARSIGG
jgi:putative NADH-flavin reductase